MHDAPKIEENWVEFFGKPTNVERDMQALSIASGAEGAQNGEL